MRLLAVETTSETGSLCIAENFKILSTRSWKKKSIHSDVITLELTSALQEAGFSLEQITHAAVDVGPGSFTGIRVGVSFVRSLAYSLDIRVRVASSLEVLAFQCLKPGQSALVAIPAIQNFYYAASFMREDGRAIPQGAVQSHEFTDLSARPRDEVCFPKVEPRAETLVSLVEGDSKKPSFIAWKDVIPLYVRASEAEEKLRRGLLKPSP